MSLLHIIFEKRTKAIEDQGQKQVDNLKNLKPKKLEAIKDNKCDDNKKLLKYNEVFNELSNERIVEIYNMSKQIDFNNLTCYIKGQNIALMNFISFKGLLHTYDINNSNILIEKIEEDQI